MSNDDWLVTNQITGEPVALIGSRTCMVEWCSGIRSGPIVT
jgi:hypothetical protein